MLLNMNHPVTKDCPPSLTWGPGVALGPIIVCKDETVQVLAMSRSVPGVSSSGQYLLSEVYEPGLVVKEMGDWTSIWCGVPSMPTELLRGVARSAGVHIYNDAGDFVCANNVVLAVHPRYAGKRTIQLPRRCKVTDAFDGTVVTKNAKSFVVNLKQFETRMWWLDDAD